MDSESTVNQKSSVYRTEALCQYRGIPCTKPRMIKPDGSLHYYCENHRRQAALQQRRLQLLQQHQRLLCRAAASIHRNSPAPTVSDISSSSGVGTGDLPQRQPQDPPRFVLLGNQNTLILGLVLSRRDSAELHRQRQQVKRRG